MSLRCLRTFAFSRLNTSSSGDVFFFTRLFRPRAVAGYDLQGVFEKLFHPAWETDDRSGMSTVVMTYNDYFNDLKLWCSEYFFCKMVRECFDQVVVRYVEDLLRHSHFDGKPFRDPLAAAQQIRNDRVELTSFFTRYESELEQAGIRPPLSIEERVQTLPWFANVMEKLFTEDLADIAEVSRILTQFGMHGCRVMMLLIRLHPRRPDDHTELMVLNNELLAMENVMRSGLAGPKFSSGVQARDNERFLMDFLEEETSQAFVRSAMVARIFAVR